MWTSGMHAMKLCVDMDNEPDVSWVKSRLTNVGDVVVSVCYTPPDQDVVIDETFFRQLWQSSRLPPLVLMGTLKHLSICCKRNTDVLHLLAIPEILGVR